MGHHDLLSLDCLGYTEWTTYWYWSSLSGNSGPWVEDAADMIGTDSKTMAVEIECSAGEWCSCLFNCIAY